MERSLTHIALFAALIAISVVSGVLYLLVELAAKRVWWRAL